MVMDKKYQKKTEEPTKETTEMGDKLIADAPIEEKIETPVEIKKPVSVIKVEIPVVNDNLISIRVFATASGIKWDQIAGFVHYANANKLGPFDMIQWRNEYEKFLKKPC